MAPALSPAEECGDGGGSAVPRGKEQRGLPIRVELPREIEAELIKRPEHAEVAVGRRRRRRLAAALVCLPLEASRGGGAGRERAEADLSREGGV